ncbi:hypothetical protein NX801_29930 [Streptomyces sp. LP05-1]|uniref:Uncharacterized protein n=1 Tax=Streptomyces pyxinae TaxID=2970734 RepID=A0ABT2CQT2_9ACTN|nr:hypothetical protein [Streptomyces sp. LP05-1]MCS0639783.1 hypothetical protein [Streptomyces sp. LP05-1]
MDQEPWRRAGRHEGLRGLGIDVEPGEQLFATLTALTLHAATLDAVAAGRPLTTDTLRAIPLSTVAEAATAKRDYEFLAGLPAQTIDAADAAAVNRFRLATYSTGRTSRWLFSLTRELHHTMITLARRSPHPSPDCGQLTDWVRDLRKAP